LNNTTFAISAIGGIAQQLDDNRVYNVNGWNFQTPPEFPNFLPYKEIT
jgi:hypothetical protein